MKDKKDIDYYTEDVITRHVSHSSIRSLARNTLLLVVKQAVASQVALTQNSTLIGCLILILCKNTCSFIEKPRKGGTVCVLNYN